ncbi:putative methyltransferase-domain-containing protein [Hyaloscypha finlandica]|nr:putative methyltransferase-domain-containing protein [Hyaloscypha finlandica]
MRGPPGADPESNGPEDVLSSSLAVIFPDDITNQHDPQGEDSKKLFSHFLWNAGLQLAEFIEEGDEQGRDWSVDGEKVLELGAGTGLAGILAGLKGAREVVISDYPAPEVLENLRANVERNFLSRKDKTGVGEGHEWGVLDDAFSKENKESFGWILVADCLWMPWQHLNLLKSIRCFFKEGGKAWVVAGFHTGRAKMRGFYEESVLMEAGLEIEKIWERNAEGEERQWVLDRGIEGVSERKRWLVIGILRRREG